MCVHIQLFRIDMALFRHITYMNYIRKPESTQNLKKLKKKEVMLVKCDCDM